MKKANKGKKTRTGIYVQESAGVATAGDGLASKEEKSPVTKKLAMAEGKKAKCGRTGGTNTSLGKVDKPSEGSGAPHSLDAPPRPVELPEVNKGRITTCSSSIANQGSIPPGKVDKAHFSGGVVATSCSTSTSTAHKKLPSSGGINLASGGTVTLGLNADQGAPPPSSVGIPPSDGSGTVTLSSTSTEERNSKTIKRNLRNAERLVKVLGAIPAADLDSTQSTKLSWARSTLRTHSNDLTSKRQRSFEVTIPEPKRSKVHNTSTHTFTRKDLSFSEALKDKFIFAVIDRSNADGAISFDQWTTVLNKLQASYWALMMENPGEPATFEDAGWHQGRVKLVAFDGERSRDLYKLAVSRLEGLWPGAKLDVIAREDIPCRPRARTRLPAELSSKDIILKMIQFGNPSLPTHDWKVAKLEDPAGPYRSAIIVINKDSLAPLVSTQGVIKFGWSTITLKVYKKDEESATAAPPTLQDEPSVKEPATGIDLSTMEVDATSTPSTPATPAKINSASDMDDPTVDTLSDMETEDSWSKIMRKEDELLRSPSVYESDEDLDNTVVGVGLSSCNQDGAVTSD